jgi:hypothetical protein
MEAMTHELVVRLQNLSKQAASPFLKAAEHSLPQQRVRAGELVRIIDVQRPLRRHQESPHWRRVKGPFLHKSANAPAVNRSVWMHGIRQRLRLRIAVVNFRMPEVQPARGIQFPRKFRRKLIPAHADHKAFGRLPPQRKRAFDIRAVAQWRSRR